MERRAKNRSSLPKLVLPRASCRRRRRRCPRRSTPPTTPSRLKPDWSFCWSCRGDGRRNSSSAKARVRTRCVPWQRHPLLRVQVCKILASPRATHLHSCLGHLHSCLELRVSARGGLHPHIQVHLTQGGASLNFDMVRTCSLHHRALQVPPELWLRWAVFNCGITHICIS